MKKIKRFSEEYFRAVAAGCEDMMFAGVPDVDGGAEPHVFSERFEDSIRQVMEKLDGPKKGLSGGAKLAIALAAALLAVLLAAMSVGAVRERVFRLFFIEKDQSYAVMYYRSGDGESADAPGAEDGALPDTLEKLYLPAYIPKGFDLAEESCWHDYSRKMIYKKVGTDESIVYEQSVICYVFAFDIEDKETRTVSINGYDVLFVTGKDGTEAYWCDDEYIFRINGDISLREAERIVRSVAAQ